MTTTNEAKALRALRTNSMSTGAGRWCWGAWVFSAEPQFHVNPSKPEKDVREIAASLILDGSPGGRWPHPPRRTGARRLGYESQRRSFAGTTFVLRAASTHGRP